MDVGTPESLRLRVTSKKFSKIDSLNGTPKTS